MEIGEVPTPVPGPGEVQVRVTAAALNHIDLWLRRGLPALHVSLPHVSGGDVCGVVSELGPGVAPRAGAAVGDRVLGIESRPLVRPVRRLPRRARQFLPRLSDARRAGLGRRGRVPGRAGAEPGAGAARPHPARRRCAGGAADLLPDRLADAGRARANPSGGDRAGAGSRLGGRQRGNPDRQAVRRAGDCHRIDRRQAGLQPARWAPTRRSTTRRPSWWPR